MPCLFQNPGGNIILSCPVSIYDRFNDIFRHIIVICQKLFGILRQTISTVTERRIVVMIPNSWVKTNAFNDLAGVQTAHLCIGVQFIKVTNPQCQIRIGKQLDRLCFRTVNNERWDILFDCSFLQQSSKLFCFFFHCRICLWNSYNDSGRIKIIIEGTAFTKKLRAEQDPRSPVLCMQMVYIAHRYSGFNHYGSCPVTSKHLLDDRFHRGCVKEIFYRIIIGRCSNDNELCISISCSTVRCGS